MLGSPLVSICCLTFNHESYIRKCLDSFMTQKCDFDFEILIHDDASTDGTAKIIREYEKKYVDVIKPFYQTENQYSKGLRSLGVRYNFPRAKGRYIAICEGDDFWIDPYKLQKQVDFLENNSDYILCFTDRNILINEEVQITPYLYNTYSFDQTEIPYIHIPTLTVLFRNIKTKIPIKMLNNLIDTSLFLFLSQFGKFYYLRDKTAVYRVHDKGIYSGSSDFINFSRSASARLSAWIYLKNIDKLALADNLIFCYRLKKDSAIKDKKYLAALSSTMIESFFILYLFVSKKLQKIK